MKLNEELKLHIGNLTKSDVKFITGVVGLFTDPKCDKLVERIRDGELGIQYNPKDGVPHLCEINEETMDPVAEHVVIKHHHIGPIPGTHLHRSN